MSVSDRVLRKLNPFYRQLPAHSPISARALASAFREAARPARDDPREELRSLLVERFDADGVVLTGSGTQALQLALQHAAAMAPNPAVALPAYGCFDIGSAVVGAGVPVLFYDIVPETLQPDWKSVAAALANGAGVILIAPLYGVPVDWQKVEEVAAGAIVIEDAAQAYGASWNGRPVGSFGDFTVLSFGRGKGWTGGGGGAMLWRGEAIVQPPRDGGVGGRRLLKAVAQWALGRPGVYRLPASLPFLRLGETVYTPPSPIQAMPRFAARMLLDTSADAEAEALRRRAVAESYPFPAIAQSGVSGHLRFPIVLGYRNSRLLRGTGRLGVGPPYPCPLPELEALRSRIMSHSPAPGAERLTRELITLPTHSMTSSFEVESLTAALAAGRFRSPTWRRWLANIRTLGDRALQRHRRRAAVRRTAEVGGGGILILCEGNVCRSPYAGARLAAELAARRIPLEVASAGFLDDGFASPRQAIAVARRHGIDLSRHRSRRVTAEMLADAALVVVMDRRQASKLVRRHGIDPSAVILLGDLDPTPGQRRTIADPIELPEAVFEECYRRIDRCIGQLGVALSRQTRSDATPTHVTIPGGTITTSFGEAHVGVL